MPVRLTITIDDDVYANLKKKVPAEKLSAFITGAVRDRLRLGARVMNAAYKAARQESWRAGMSDDWEHTEDEGWPC